MFTPLDLIKNVADLIAFVRAQLSDDETPAVVCIDTLNRSLVGSEIRQGLEADRAGIAT
jgi:hypothetical protein